MSETPLRARLEAEANAILSEAEEQAAYDNLTQSFADDEGVVIPVAGEMIPDITDHRRTAVILPGLRPYVPGLAVLVENESGHEHMVLVDRVIFTRIKNLEPNDAWRCGLHDAATLCGVQRRYYPEFGDDVSEEMTMVVFQYLGPAVAE